MVDPIVYDTWNGLDFGWNGTTHDFGLVESPGLLGLSNDGDTLTGGFGGAAFSPLYPVRKAWTTVVEVRAADDATWRERRDLLRAATSSPEEGEYTVHDAGQVRTVFARVTDRDMPRDADGEVWNAVEAQITFEAIDPIIYGPTEDIEFTGSSGSEVIDTAGWVPTERWKWVVPGPVTNPQIGSSVDPSAVVRYVGTIGSSQTLIVELLPKGSAPGYYAKVVDDADVDDYRTFGVGTNAYPNLDAGGSGSALPPQWFPIRDGITVSYLAASGTGGCTFTWRPGFD